MTVNLTEYSGCTPHAMTTLTNLSVNATTFVWDFGDGTVITTTDSIPPVYSYTTVGTYTITLTASNSYNQATATILPIIIIEGPVTTFNPSVTNGCAPQIINFTNTTIGASLFEDAYFFFFGEFLSFHCHKNYSFLSIILSDYLGGGNI
ncbi:MAG: PKD domain-containing protein [Crocinitomicaceae bacterium]|nr:PKD domain-containing protein [Crocinitomicaceae bacterium]